MQRGKDPRVPLRTLTNHGGVASASADLQPDAPDTDGDGSQQSRSRAEPSAKQLEGSSGHIIARTCVPMSFPAYQEAVASQPPPLADHDAVAAAAPQQPPSDTSQQQVSELLERLAAQQRDIDRSLQQQQAAFQATLREEVDIRVALQTEALQDENDALRDQLERSGGGASPPTQRRSLSAGSLGSLLASPLPGSPAPLHLQRMPTPQSPVQRSVASQPDSPSAPYTNEVEMTPTAAVLPRADGRHEPLVAELAAAHSRIADLQRALQAATGGQNGASAAVVAEGHAFGELEAEELQQLRQAVRDAKADAAAAQDVAHGAELDAEDARQQCSVLQAAWDADAQRRQEAAHDLQRQLADVRAEAAEAAADTAAVLLSAKADTAAADGARSAAEAAEAAAQAEAAQLRAQLQDANSRLQEAAEADIALPQRDDCLGWVAADVAGSPAAAAQLAAAGTTHSSVESRSTDGPAAERQDSSVTELHMQVHRLTEELAAVRRTLAAEAAAQSEELQAANAATRAAEHQGAAAAEAVAARIADLENQLAERRAAAAAAEQQAAELQTAVQDAEEQIQSAEAACDAARQQAADAERIASQLRQQLSDGQLASATLQQHLAEAVHERDAACAELDAARTATALTDGAITASAAAAHGPAGAACVAQLHTGTTPALTLFSPGLHNALAAADARLHGGWTLRRGSSGSVTAAVWPDMPTSAASGTAPVSAPHQSTRSASATISGSSAAVSEALSVSGTATPQDSASDDGDGTAFEPMSEVRRKRLRLTPSKAAEAPASADASADAQGGSSAMPDDAESSVWSDSEDEASASGWLGGGAARPSDAMASTPGASPARSALHWSMREADPPALRDRQLRQLDEADGLREQLAQARGCIAAERERVAGLRCEREALQQQLQDAAPAATAGLAQQLAETRHELREARGRVEVLLQEKATLEGRLAAMHDADTGPAAMAERHRLEAALQEAAFLRGRIAAMEHAGSSHQHEQQQEQQQMHQQVAALEAAAAEARAALAAERRAAGNAAVQLHGLQVANEALLAAHEAAEARAQALEAVGTELQVQCCALQTAGSATKSNAAGPARTAEVGQSAARLRSRVGELEATNAASAEALHRSQQALAAEQLARADEQQHQWLHQQQDEQQRLQQQPLPQTTPQPPSLWTPASDAGLTPASHGSASLAAVCASQQEELGRVRAERDELALRFAEAEGLAEAISAELSPPDSDADEAISSAQGTPHVAAVCATPQSRHVPAGSGASCSTPMQLETSLDRLSYQAMAASMSTRRCLALTPPLPDTESRGRRRVQQLYSAGRADTPPQLHEHAAAVQQAFVALQERVSEKDAAAQQLAASLAASQAQCATTAAALAAAEAALASGCTIVPLPTYPQTGSCSPGGAAVSSARAATQCSGHVQQPSTPPQAPALGASAATLCGTPMTDGVGSTGSTATIGASSGSAACASDFAFWTAPATPAAASASQILPAVEQAGAQAAAVLQQWTEEIGAQTSPQLRQARQQAETLLFTLQREAAAHQAAEAELAAAAESAAAEANRLRERISELEAAQAAPDRQSVAAVQQQAEAAERWAAAAQAQADARSEETEEAYEQAALLDGALAAAEATQADLAQQVEAIMVGAAELGCAMEAAADDLATQRSATAQALERAERSPDGATAADATSTGTSAPALAVSCELPTTPGSSCGGGGGGGGSSMQRGGSAASLSSIEAEHLASGAWLSPAQAEFVNSEDDLSSSCATGAACPERAGDALGAAADPTGQRAAVPAAPAAPSAGSEARLQPRRHPAPGLAVVPTGRRASLTTALYARVQVAEEAAEDARQRAAESAAAVVRCRGRASKAARQGVRAQREATQARQDAGAARQDVHGARQEAAGLAAAVAAAAADRSELSCRLDEAQGSVQQLQQAVQQLGSYNAELIARLGTAPKSGAFEVVSEASAAKLVCDGVADTGEQPGGVRLLRAQLALQQGIAQLAVAVALDRVAPGRGDAKCVAARVAAMLAAEPEAAEAAGLRPVWLTLQALSAQDAAAVGGVHAPDSTTAAALDSATATGTCLSALQHDSMHSVGALVGAGLEGLTSGGGSLDTVEPASWQPEATAGEHSSSSSTCSSWAASPMRCSSHSSSGGHEGDAFEQLNSMDAVLRHGISRSGSDGSLWEDSSAEDS